MVKILVVVEVIEVVDEVVEEVEVDVKWSKVLKRKMEPIPESISFKLRTKLMLML